MKRFLSSLVPALALIVSGVAPRAHAEPVVLERLEASVNTSLILLSDVVKFRETLGLRQQLDPLFAGTRIASQGERSSDADIVQFLVDERLIQQAFHVGDAEVEQEINSILAANKISRDQLKETLRSQGFTYDEYFEMIRSSASKRNLIDRDIRTKVTIADDDVKNYFYNYYAKKSSSPMQYKLKLILVNPGNYKNPQAARETAERALRDIRGGESFEEVAKRVSDDASGSHGGDFGTFAEDQVVPVIREQVKKLKLGQVSDVFGSPQAGFFILKIADVVSGESSRYEKMKEEIRGQLAAAEYQRQIQLWLERQRQTAFIHLAGQSAVTGIPGARK